jgi:biopolymer transport protein ExbB
MKQGLFITILIVAALAISSYIYFGIFGQAEEKSLLHHLYQGGPLVIVLITLSLMDITFVIERSLSLRKAKGRGSLNVFLRKVQQEVKKGDIDAAIAACDQQRGSMANVIRNGLERYKIASESSNPGEKKEIMEEVQKSIEEAMMLEVPLLERNLVALSTIASVATMVGLLGTTIGMIRAFQALARAGAPDAVQLSIGISEALVNTAGGLFAAILGILAYNFFTTKVDNFTYMIDEATLSIVETLTFGSRGPKK